jgi:bacterioferritin-associated ferredoxin
MIVCICHRISDRQIQQAVKDGVRDFDELQDDTCIARNCGCCEDCARQVFDQAVATITVHRAPCTPPARREPTPALAL